MQKMMEDFEFSHVINVGQTVSRIRHQKFKTHNLLTKNPQPTHFIVCGNIDLHSWGWYHFSIGPVTPVRSVGNNGYTTDHTATATNIGYSDTFMHR